MRVALAALSLALVAAHARADCGADEAPSVGLTLRRCEDPGRRWVEVEVDLAAADVGVRASRPEERGDVIDAWAQSVDGVVVAIPGGPFRFPELDPAGLTVGDGERWTSTRDDASLAVLAFDVRADALLAPAEQIVPAEAWMHDVLSGVEVLRDGVPRACQGGGCEPAPRTGVGLSSDGRTLVLVAAEGYRADAAGVDDGELGALLVGAGAFRGLRSGEGGESVMWLRGEGAIVPPSDGALRAGAAFFGVIDRNAGATGQLVGVVERAGDTMPLPDAHLRVETTDGRVAIEGGTMTSNAYFAFTLPARDYVVRASLTGYRTSCRVCRVEAGGETWCSQFLSPGDGEERCDAPPRGIDAGPWPTGDAGPPPSDASNGRELRATGCAIVPGEGSRSILVALAIALLVLRSRSR